MKQLFEDFVSENDPKISNKECLPYRNCIIGNGHM